MSNVCVNPSPSIIEQENSVIRVHEFQVREWRAGRREAPPCPEMTAAYHRALDAKVARGTYPPKLKPGFIAKEISGLGRVLKFIGYLFVFTMLLGVAGMAVVNALQAGH